MAQPQAAAAPAADEAVIKVSGALKGVVRIKSFGATVGELRAEVARLLGEACRQQQVLCMTCAVRDMLTTAALACMNRCILSISLLLSYLSVHLLSAQPCCARC